MRFLYRRIYRVGCVKLILFFISKAATIFLVSFICFSLIRTHLFPDLKKGSSALREFRISLFYAYILTMSVFLFMPNSYIVGSNATDYFDMAGNFKNILSSSKINLIPFRTIKNYILYASPAHVVLNILGNTFLFIPFGYLIAKIYPQFQKAKNICLILSMSILSIEIIQLTVGRTLDIDDFLLNFLGGLLGYLLSLIDQK